MIDWTQLDLKNLYALCEDSENYEPGGYGEYFDFRNGKWHRDWLTAGIYTGHSTDCIYFIMLQPIIKKGIHKFLHICEGIQTNQASAKANPRGIYKTKYTVHA